MEEKTATSKLEIAVFTGRTMTFSTMRGVNSCVCEHVRRRFSGSMTGAPWAGAFPMGFVREVIGRFQEGRLRHARGSARMCGRGMGAGSGGRDGKIALPCAYAAASEDTQTPDTTTKIETHFQAHLLQPDLHS